MEDLFKLAETVITKAREKSVKIALAESCTGGMAATALTSVSGSSDTFERGFVTYSNESKNELLGVSINTLKKFGAVSAECVEEMAIGAIHNSYAHISVSVSGIAGPLGGTKQKPVGLVFFGYFNKRNNSVRVESIQFTGDRSSVRIQATKRALEILLVMLDEISI